MMCDIQSLLEEQLSDGREWLLDTESLGLVDIAAHFHLNWARAFRNLKEVLDAKSYPKTFAVRFDYTRYLRKSNTTH